MSIGNLIIKRRKQLGLTQRELAKNICTQSTISKIEKGNLVPNSQLLKEFANRLEVSISYFYSEEYFTDNDKKTDELIKDIRSAINKTENESAMKIIRENENFIDSLTNNNHVHFFKMTKAYLDYYLFNKKDNAIKDLKSLLDGGQLNDNLNVEILCLLGIIYYENKHYVEASKNFEQALELSTEETPFEIKIRILYNHALNLESLSQDRKALEYTIEGIELLIENQSMYNLGYFYSFKGYLLNKFNDLDEAIKAYETATVLFSVLDYTKMYNFTRLNLLELTQKKEKKNEKKD